MALSGLDGRQLMSAFGVELLSFLAKHAGRVATHKQILTAVWRPVAWCR
jgi:DNA-binding winged helix-turn-helix (wHTH) protein